MKYEVTFIGKKTYTVESWKDSLVRASEDLKVIHPSMNLEIFKLELKND